MKVVIQRVRKASVSVSEQLVSSIQRGLCVLVGIGRDDTDKDMEFIVRKILNIRLFNESEDENSSSAKWQKSVVDRDMDILCVSQFTLQSTLKGNKPDFHVAMSSEQSRIFYEQFLQRLRASYKAERIHDGRFGEYMQVDIQNDGPVTIQFEF